MPYWHNPSTRVKLERTVIKCCPPLTHLQAHGQSNSSTRVAPKPRITHEMSHRQIRALAKRDRMSIEPYNTPMEHTQPTKQKQPSLSLSSRFFVLTSRPCARVYTINAYKTHRTRAEAANHLYWPSVRQMARLQCSAAHWTFRCFWMARGFQFAASLIRNLPYSHDHPGLLLGYILGH